MVTHELKISPQSVREWCLSDLVDIISDIISKNDLEMYSYYCEK